MKWTRRFFSLGLVFALLAGVSCTAADSPNEPTVAQPIEQQPAYLLGGVLMGLVALSGGVVDLAGGAVGGVLGITDLLACSQEKYEVTRETIGPEGGKVKVGKHVLVIPRGALPGT